MKYAKIELPTETRFLAYQQPEYDVATGVQVSKWGNVYQITMANVLVSKENEITKEEFKLAYKDAIASFKVVLNETKKNGKWKTRHLEITILMEQGKGATSIARTLGISRDYVYKIRRKKTKG